VSGNYEQQFNRLLEDFTNKKILEYEEEHLEEKYFDYKMLVKEYREGIMLFQLMEDEVWQKAVDDSVGLREYYEENKENYKWQKRVDAIIYNSQNKEVISEIKKLIANGDSIAFSKEQLEDKYNKDATLALQVESDKYEAGENSIIDRMKNEEGLQELSANDRHILVYIKETLPPEVKPFNEIKGLVISDYQNQLEKQWLDELQKKYIITVNEEELTNVYKQLIKG
ncbi:peptidyl-prolyl cis-trans isomerase, partial [Fulvivirga aurantia]|uniref:peptidylprolyl isomerase n=1 Tax=Fulvivirga aurantia TaxID=2529383 RepID=UPI001629A80D